jgi:hypothetical protein
MNEYGLGYAWTIIVTQDITGWLQVPVDYGGRIFEYPEIPWLERTVRRYAHHHSALPVYPLPFKKT